MESAQHYIEDILHSKVANETVVELKGWLYNKRSSGKVKFIEFRDGTGILQCVLHKSHTEEAAFAAFDEAEQEASIVIKGKVAQSPRGDWELHLQELKLIAPAKDYPITPKEHGPHFLLDRRHLWIRSKKQMATLRIRAEVIRAARNFFDNRGFTLFDAPIFTPNACEGTSELFEIDYFNDQKAYLTQSGQLYAEAGAMALGKVYVLGPTFRAEKSKTRRHLTEFWMLEPEVAYLDVDGSMQLAEDMLCDIVQEVLANRKHELALLGRSIEALEKIKKPFARMHYKEAAEYLEKHSKDNFKEGMDFGGGDESILSSLHEQPLFVHRFPKNIKAFYMKEDEADSKYSLSFDLLAPDGYGEIIGGSERETSLPLLEKKIAEHKLNQADFEWYLDLRRFGNVPHAGFGMGIERLVAWLCGSSHVRETIPFPRMITRLTP